MPHPLLDAARAAHAAGLCVVPAHTDGTKRPGLKSWLDYQHARPDPDQLDTWFTGDRYDGLGIICGQISGNVEMLEIEGRAVHDGTLDQIIELARDTGLIGLLDRICDGYQEHTPSGGLHWLYRLVDAPVPGNLKIARRPGPEQDGRPTVDVLAETRGEGGFVVVAPSGGRTHPTGQPWTLELGGFDQIADITQAERLALHELIATFDAMPAKTEQTAPTRTSANDGARPGDDYNQRTTWPDILEPAGWTRVFQRGDITYWRRPGKTDGVSATTNALGTDRLKVFTSSTEFDSDTTYDRLGAYACINRLTIADAASRLRQDGYGAPSTHKAPTNATSDSHRTLPRVVINGRPLAAITDEILHHLEAANNPHTLFIRAGAWTRVRNDEKGRPIVEPMGPNHVRHHVARVAHTVHITKDKHETHKPCPHEVLSDLLVHPTPPFPPLKAIVELPTMRPDGTIHTAPGYDPATGLLHIPHPDINIPPIPDQPTTEQTAAALNLIVNDLLGDFPFDTTADRANAVGLILTPIIRPAIRGQIPLALLDAPEPGTGKGLLANVIATIATGHPAAARPLSNGDEEVRKMLTSVLMEGPSLIVLDNVEDAIRSPALAAVLTTDEWSDRILGHSETVTVPNWATWIATGNNVTVGGDIARRCYRVRLDAHQAQPYTRTGFRHPDLLHWAATNRGQLVAALLTLARSWWVAGQPPSPDAVTIGGFTPWAHTIGGILHHAGCPRFLDNLYQFHSAADMESESWETFLTTVHEEYSKRTFTMHELVTSAQSEYGTIGPTIPADLADQMHRPSFSKRLGHAFRKREGRRYGPDELAILRAGQTSGKVAKWTVVPMRGVLSTEEPRDEHAESRGSRGSAGFSHPHHMRARTHAHAQPAQKNPAEPAEPRDDPLDF